VSGVVRVFDRILHGYLNSKLWHLRHGTIYVFDRVIFVFASKKSSSSSSSSTLFAKCKSRLTGSGPQTSILSYVEKKL